LPQTLFRREAQALQRQSQVNAEVARAGGGAAARRVEQVLFDSTVHLDSASGKFTPTF
jgi:hypothetical protein